VEGGEGKSGIRRGGKGREEEKGGKRRGQAPPNILA